MAETVTFLIFSLAAGMVAGVLDSYFETGALFLGLSLIFLTLVYLGIML